MRRPHAQFLLVCMGCAGWGIFFYLDQSSTEISTGKGRWSSWSPRAGISAMLTSANHLCLCVRLSVCTADRLGRLGWVETEAIMASCQLPYRTAPSCASRGRRGLHKRDCSRAIQSPHFSSAAELDNSTSREGGGPLLTSSPACSPASSPESSPGALVPRCPDRPDALAAGGAPGPWQSWGSRKLRKLGLVLVGRFGRLAYSVGVLTVHTYMPVCRLCKGHHDAFVVVGSFLGDRHDGFQRFQKDLVGVSSSG